MADQLVIRGSKDRNRDDKDCRHKRYADDPFGNAKSIFEVFDHWLFGGIRRLGTAGCGGLVIGMTGLGCSCS